MRCGLNKLNQFSRDRWYFINSVEIRTATVFRQHLNALIQAANIREYVVSNYSTIYLCSIESCHIQNTNGKLNADMRWPIVL